MKRVSKRKKDVEEKNNRIRNVIAEIQKVDQETADLRTVVQEAQKINKTLNDVGKKEAIISCRLLFASVFDKIAITILLGLFVILTLINLRGNIFSGTYSYWNKIIIEFGIILLIVILYFIFNWIYHAINKTIICLTKNNIYKESYLPLIRRETVIPLKHVSSISTVNFCVIFRILIIHQYNYFPIIFFTWDNRKFKRKFEELSGEGGRLKNIYEFNNIIDSNYYHIIKKIFIGFIVLLILLGIINSISYLLSPESRIVGKYTCKKESIHLKSNGSCKLELNGISKLETCKWRFISNDDQINIEYTFIKNGKEKKDKLSATFGNRIILYKGVQFVRE